MPKFVNIATYGRSGSTLLAGILNLLPGWYIRGETMLATKGLFDFWLRSGKALAPSCKARESPWRTDVWPDRDLLCRTMREMLEAYYDPTRKHEVIGSKEVSYDQVQTREEFWEFLDFQRMLTGCLFVINTRNIDKVIASAWWAEDPEGSRRIVGKVDEWLTSYAAEHREYCIVVRYEDVIRPETGEVRRLFEWLGAGDHYDEGALRKTLQLRWGY